MRDAGIKVTPGSGVAAAEDTGAARRSRSAAGTPPRAPIPARGPAAKEKGPRHVMSHTRIEPARAAAAQRAGRARIQPAMFVKAFDSAADFIFLDLEDAVAPADKVRRGPM